MTVLVKETHQGRRYEVRTAGRSIRLYTNGAFHSQWHPGDVFQGAVWDLLSLPALLSLKPPQTVLALGVGGGTALHQLHKIIGWKRAVGIEIDPHHLRFAQRYFKLQYPGLNLIQADAVQYISAQTKRFDYLIDDIFIDDPKDPKRPVSDIRDWFGALIERTAPGGIVIQNHLEAHLALSFFTEHAAFFKTAFNTVFLLQSQRYANGVLAGFQGPCRTGDPLQIFQSALRPLGVTTRNLKTITISRLQ